MVGCGSSCEEGYCRSYGLACRRADADSDPGKAPQSSIHLTRGDGESSRQAGMEGTDLITFGRICTQKSNYKNIIAQASKTKSIQSLDFGAQKGNSAILAWASLVCFKEGRHRKGMGEEHITMVVFFSSFPAAFLWGSMCGSDFIAKALYIKWIGTFQSQKPCK